MDAGRVVAEGDSATALSDGILRSAFAIRARRIGTAIVPWERV